MSTLRWYIHYSEGTETHRVLQQWVQSMQQWYDVPEVDDVTVDSSWPERGPEVD